MSNLNTEVISVNVGQRLRNLREERDISMRELARRSSLSANALSMIERGLTSPSVARWQNWQMHWKSRLPHYSENNTIEKMLSLPRLPKDRACHSHADCGRD